MDKSAPRGYSIMDILLAAALVVVVAGLAIPSLQSSMRGYRLSDAANQVAAELNTARVLAVSRGTTYRVDFSVERNSYQLIDLSDPQNPTRREKVLDGSLRVVSVPDDPILFTSRGAARGGTVVFANDAGKQMSVEVTASGQTVVHDRATVSETYLH